LTVVLGMSLCQTIAECEKVMRETTRIGGLLLYHRPLKLMKYSPQLMNRAEWVILIPLPYFLVAKYNKLLFIL